ncbi:MAG: TetR/AcrR family transcriptional regulator C-terminal domain-containing protein [Methanomethylophilus sp.]|jgi:probable dihydroxyacetone kinase regulator
MSDNTKAQIVEAFKELLNEKEYGKITISDIAERCNISRQTFYYHFKNIFDMVVWIFEQDTKSDPRNSGGYVPWRLLVRESFEYCQQNKSLIMQVLRSPEREKLSSYFIEFSIKKISEALMIKTDGRMDPKDVDFIARVYAYAYSGIILKWISEGMPDDGIELAEKIDTVVSASMNPVIEALMKKSAENKKPETL